MPYISKTGAAMAVGHTPKLVEGYIGIPHTLEFVLQPITRGDIGVRQTQPGLEVLQSRIVSVQSVQIDGRQESFAFVQRLYAGTELAALLRDAGFAHVDLFGGVDGSPYDPDAKRLVAVATA